MAIDNFYIRDRAAILPGSFQRSSYMNELLGDIANGFNYIDGKTGISSGTSSTLSATSDRYIFFTGNNLTYTLTLPTAPTTAVPPPPIRIMNCGTGNVITISGGASKIMSGSTAGEITLRTPGDYIELQYVDSTIGWAILAIRSNRSVACVADPTTIQLNRFQTTFIDTTGLVGAAIHFPTDKQIGEVCDIFLVWDSNTTVITFGDGTESVMGSASAYDWRVYSGGVAVRAWWTGATWVLSHILAS